MAIDDTGKAIQQVKEFLESRHVSELQEAIRLGKESISIDFSTILEFDSGVAELFLDQPEDMFKVAELAIKEIDEHANVVLRVVNLPRTNQLQIRDIDPKKWNHHLLSIQGMVRRRSQLYIKDTMIAFECPACGNMIRVPQLDEATLTEPDSCTCGRRGKFKQSNSTETTKFYLTAEETPDMIDNGSDLKRIEIQLTDDLASVDLYNKLMPGKVLKINGILEKENLVSKRTGKKRPLSTVVLKANSMDFIEESYEDVTLTNEDKIEIEQLAADPQILPKLIKSIFKGIHGYDLEKKAMVLQQFGGVRTLHDNITTRGDVHILLIGDPGTSKSTMLKIIQKISPRSRYASGRSTSGVGLTAAAIRDEKDGGYYLEAGIIPLTNKGIAMIDELDKMNELDRKYLNEAMSEQTISIAKAGIQATLQTQTSILAAANPKLGRFNAHDDMYKQFDLDSTLVNRFDLIFPIRASFDEKTNKAIAQEILLRGRDNPKLTADNIDPHLIKKYIALARKLKPVIPLELNPFIEDFFVKAMMSANPDLSTNYGVKPVPMSPRFIQSIVRLAQASAKVRLSEKVNKHDLKIAIELLSHFLKMVGTDPETGKIDIDIIETGLSASYRGHIHTVKDLIKGMQSKSNGPASIFEIVKACEAAGIDANKAEEIITRLKKDGDINEPKSGFLQVM